MKPLKRQPNIGDVIVRIAETDNEFIQGNEYVVIDLDEDGDAEVKDRSGSVTVILNYELGRFCLKEENEEDPGEISVHSAVETQDGLFEVVVFADSKGLSKIKELSEKHRKAVAASNIKAQIAELEKKLKEL